MDIETSTFDSVDEDSKAFKSIMAGGEEPIILKDLVKETHEKFKLVPITVYDGDNNEEEEKSAEKES